MTHQNNPTHAKPDEVEAIIRKAVDAGYWIGVSDGDVREKSQDVEMSDAIAEAKAELLAYFTARERQILQKLLDNGHGGGNWRRLIIQELDTLGLQEETHE